MCLCSHTCVQPSTALPQSKSTESKLDLVKRASGPDNEVHGYSGT